MEVQPRSSRELRVLIDSSDFVDWSQRHAELRQAVSKRRREELLESGDPAVEMMFRAGELEEQAAKYYAEYAAVENESLEKLSAYESQRMRATQYWMVWHAAEKRLEDARAEVSELTAQAEAAKKSKSADALKIHERLRESEKQRDQLATIATRTKTESDRQYALRLSLWEKVEDSWHQSLRSNLARSEYAYQARRCRAEAEALFAGALDDNESRSSDQDATVAVQEAERQYFEHIDAARERFSCVLIEEFVYVPIADDSKWVWCVPLVDEADQFNVQLRRLQVYQIERGRALDYIEPVAMAELETMDDEDPRLEMFFSAQSVAKRDRTQDEAI